MSTLSSVQSPLGVDDGDYSSRLEKTREKCCYDKRVERGERERVFQDEWADYPPSIELWKLVSTMWAEIVWWRNLSEKWGLQENPIESWMGYYSANLEREDSARREFGGGRGLWGGSNNHRSAFSHARKNISSLVVVVVATPINWVYFAALKFKFHPAGQAILFFHIETEDNFHPTGHQHSILMMRNLSLKKLISKTESAPASSAKGKRARQRRTKWRILISSIRNGSKAGKLIEIFSLLLCSSIIQDRAQNLCCFLSCYISFHHRCCPSRRLPCQCW